MGMLKSISLENYKCYKDKTDIEIAPLTILCGVNSSGKSSILKGLLMLKQSYESSSNLNSISLNGKYTNNGRFENITNNKSENIRLKNVFTFRHSTYMTTQEKVAMRDLSSIFVGRDRLVYTTIEVEFVVKNQNRRIVAYGDNIIENIFIKITTSAQNECYIELNLIEDIRYNILIKGLPSIKTDRIELKNTVCHFDGLQIVNLFFDTVEPNQNVDKLLADIFAIFRIIALQYKDINYISPLRNAPERRYIIEHDVENVGLYGEYVPQVLEKYKNMTGRINSVPVNDIFSDNYSAIGEKVNVSVNNWLNYFGIDNYKLTGENELLHLSIGEHNLLDVGFGISQALPIIVSGITLPYKSTLLLEQPEVHLHPRMQMAMADFLIAASMAHKNIIIETHSEHIINRISRRMMENEYIRKNTDIKFVDKDENGNSFIESIPVDPIRGIVTENEKFFREFATETEKILYAGYNNKIGQ